MVVFPNIFSYPLFFFLIFEINNFDPENIKPKVIDIESDGSH